MKRLSSSDSLGALMSVCPTTEEHSPRNNHVYGRDFRSMLDGLDEEGCVEEAGHVSEKKRRLSVEQVKALEKNFEVENKLEPERKVKLAQELGLQPRQVAVWFQNRRARWKTKQLERDYGLLKANYDALKVNFDALQRDNDSLLKEIRELKSKLQEENCTESNLSVKEEPIAPTDSDQKQAVMNPDNTCLNPQSGHHDHHHESKELNFDHQESFNDNNNNIINNNNNNMFEVSNVFPLDFKDGSSDSDSSAILNEEITNTKNGGISPLQTHQLMNMSSSSSPSPSSMNCFGSSFQKTTTYQPQFVKIEEHNFFSGEEACNFFSDEQAPTLHWYCSGEDQY